MNYKFIRKKEKSKSCFNNRILPCRHGQLQCFGLKGPGGAFWVCVCVFQSYRLQNSTAMDGGVVRPEPPPQQQQQHSSGSAESFMDKVPLYCSRGLELYCSRLEACTRAVQYNGHTIWG